MTCRRLSVVQRARVPLGPLPNLMNRNLEEYSKSAWDDGATGGRVFVCCLGSEMFIQVNK